MSKLQTRLTNQLRANGVKNAKELAISLLKKRKQMSASGKLTKAGKKRQAMGAAGRAKDRAAKRSGRPVGAYHYDPRTNRATLKKR